MTRQDASSVYYERYYDQAELDIMEQALSFRKGKKFTWTRLYPNQLKNVWSSYVRLGIVLHEKAVLDIQETMLYNVAILDVMTGCMGHKQYCGIKEMGYKYDLTPAKVRKLQRVILNEDDWACFEDGGWLLSDYGLAPLLKLAEKLLMEEDYGRKICYMDQMLNVVHARSDLASLFVIGGTKALTELSAVEHPGVA